MTHALRRLRRADGVTLVELLVVLAIMGVVITSLTTVFVRGNALQTDLNARYQAQSTARTALDRLRRDVRCASAAGGGGTTVTLTLPATCSAAASVTWCTVGSGSRWALYRKVGGTCDATGVRWLDYLEQASLFTLVPQSPSTLARLLVDLRVNARPQDVHDEYRLQDELVLRNSVRA